MAKYPKPLPLPDKDTSQYWEGCRRHELLIPRCKDCGTFCFPPMPMCPRCNSIDRCEWTRVSGRGEIYSWTVVYQATHPDFRDDVPYVCVIIQLNEQEDLRIVSTLVDTEPEEIVEGMPVEVVFDDITEECTLPKFKRIS